MLSLQKRSNAFVKTDFTTGEDKPKTLQSFSSPVRPLPITLDTKTLFLVTSYTLFVLSVE